jgi:CHAT domain-containing protein
LTPITRASARPASQADNVNQVVAELRNGLASAHDQVRASIAARAPAEVFVPLLWRELALGDQAIRTARTWVADGEMHRLILEASRDRDLVFSLIARNPTKTALVELGLEWEVVFRARYAQEQAQAHLAWKSAVAHERPALWHELGEAEDSFTRAAVLPSLVGGFDNERLKSAAARRGGVEREVAANASIGRAFQFVSSDILTSIGVRQLIDNVNFGRVLVVYVAYDDDLAQLPGASRSLGAKYLAIVAHSGEVIRAVPLGPAPPIDEAATAFLDAVGTRPERGAVFDKNAATELYHLVAEPLEHLFRYGDIEYVRQELLICADGSLQGLPFEALVENGRYLVDNYRVRLLESPADANLVTRANARALTNLFLLSNPTVPAGSALKRLSHADDEVNGISKLWPDNLRSLQGGPDATVGRFDSGAPNAGVVHVVSHGLFAPNTTDFTKEPNEVGSGSIVADRSGLLASSLARSALILSPEKPGTAPGLLSALELLNVDLSRTQLVVLSACDTNLGDKERGEGIYGLRRAVLEAGAETVVSSLWKVDDAATSELMISFYRNLAQGKGRADALEHAETFTRQSHSHPYYWAAFVLSGNQGALKLPDFAWP